MEADRVRLDLLIFEQQYGAVAAVVHVQQRVLLANNLGHAVKRGGKCNVRQTFSYYSQHVVTML